MGCMLTSGSPVFLSLGVAPDMTLQEFSCPLYFPLAKVIVFKEKRNRVSCTKHCKLWFFPMKTRPDAMVLHVAQLGVIWFSGCRCWDAKKQDCRRLQSTSKQPNFCLDFLSSWTLSMNHILPSMQSLWYMPLTSWFYTRRKAIFLPPPLNLINKH